MNKLLFLSVLFILNNSAVFSQGDFKPGYFINTNGDTTYGYIDNRSESRNTRTCYYKKTPDSKVSEYKPFEIKGYGITGGKYYESIENNQAEPPQKLFMEVLVRGTIDLYYTNTKENGVQYYAKKGNIGLQELSIKQVYGEKRDPLHSARPSKTNIKEYIGVLKYFMSDCNKVSARIQKTPLRRRQLIQLITDYNYCIDPNQKMFITSNISQNKIKLGLYSGVSISKLKFKTESDYLMQYADADFGTSTNLLFGTYLNLPLSRIYENFALQFEIQYKKNKFSGEASKHRTAPSVTIDYRNEFDFSYLNFPLFLQYNFRRKSSALYFNLGMITSIAIKSDNITYKTTTSSISGNSNDVYKDDLLDKPYNFGFIGGTGIKLFTNNKKDQYIFFECRYEMIAAMSEYWSLNSKLRVIYFTVGFNIL